MQEQNLPTPITPDKPTVQNPEVGTSTTGEIISDPTPVTPEQRTSASEQVNQGGPVQRVALPADLPQVLPTTTLVPNNTVATSSSSSNPVVADDVDVIEKVWVQKAKSIVSQTKADPHQQEEEVSKLQTDYQLKRFGEAATNK